jgi:hypothetical protein
MRASACSYPEFTRLKKDDALSLKPYARFESTLSAVHVSATMSSVFGEVLHLPQELCEQRELAVRAFEVPDNGEVVQWTPPDPMRCQLLRLHRSVQTAIYKYACTSDTSIVFDLNTRTARGLPINTMQLCREIRANSSRLQYWGDNEVTLMATSELKISNFNNFTDLQSWIDIPIFQEIFGRETYAPNTVELLLQFTYRGQAVLRDFRIDIKQLLLPLKFTQNFSVKFSRRVAEGDLLNNNEEVSVKLNAIWRAVLLLLSDIIVESPHKAARPLPQLWIDGHGNLLNATIPSTTGDTPQTIMFRHVSLSETEVRNLGYHKIFHIVRAARQEQAVRGLNMQSNYWSSMQNYYTPV